MFHSEALNFKQPWHILSGFSCLLFLAFYLILSYNNRPANDDIGLIYRGLFEDFPGFVHHYYTQWTGRWAMMSVAYFIFGHDSSFERIHLFMFLFHALNLYLLARALHQIIPFFLKQAFMVRVNFYESSILSVSFIASFYFFTPNLIEVWWWVSGALTYFQSIVLFIVGISLIIKPNYNFTDYLSIGLYFLYIGGSSEIHAAILLLTFMMVMVFEKKLRIALQNKLILTALVSLFISLLITVLADGNLQRKEILDAYVLSFPQRIVHLLELFGPRRAQVFGMLWLSIWFSFGYFSKTIQQTPLLSTLRILAYGLLASVLVPVLIQFFALKQFALPSRTISLSALFMTAILSILCFKWGTYFSSKKLLVYPLFLVKMLLITSILFNCYNQYNYSTNYARSFDRLVKVLNDSKSSSFCNIVIPPLPDPGMLVGLTLENEFILSDFQYVIGSSCAVTITASPSH